MHRCQNVFIYNRMSEFNGPRNIDNFYLNNVIKFTVLNLDPILSSKGRDSNQLL